MIKIDLITGFLGSGKTTFIRNYVKHITKKGQRVAIIENDYGAINVDRLLLQDVTGEDVDVEMIVSCPDPETHRRRYKTKLISMAMLGYDRVIIEPSGIYDVDEFFDVLYESPIDSRYEAGNVITIVDSRLEEDLSESSDYMLCSQIAPAGTVVFSKSQLASTEEIDHVKAHIQKALTRFHCKRELTDKDFLIKDWSTLTDGDYDRLLSCGYHQSSFVKMQVTHGDTYQSLFFMNLDITKEELQQKAAALLTDPSCGHVIRIKGFICAGSSPEDTEGSTGITWYEYNATAKEQTLTPIPVGQKVLIVIGEALDAEKVKAYFPNAEFKGEIR
ncbi:MAG: GTPase (G3E family) [Lachnospiraceae bacterium]|nr:GTPase (G3E family) [Lachnospiraceae bacterium]